MPTIFFYGPRLEPDKRREMVRSFTETASKLTGIEKRAFVVYLKETDLDCVGVGGELLCDREQRAPKA
ncbi:MAG: 4-oxalocrotonate tautomerase [Chloroflexi bacterium]|nr:4-oxalocrotonate tautomerase [Chloroflexota bacterium]